MRQNTLKLYAVALLLLSLFAPAITAQVCQPVAPGLVSWWSGDGNALDSRSRFNGTLQNGASFALGNSGQAFNFTAQNQFVNIPNDPALFSPTSITVEAWVNPSTYVGCNSAYRIAHTMQSQLIGWVTLINCANSLFAAELRSQTGERNVLASNSTIPAGTFTHVAFTWDGSTLSIYINGVLDNSTPTTITSIGINTDALRIGNDLTFGFIGQIDEPSVYNRALTADEIAAIYNAGTAGKCKPTATVAPSGLIGWWSGDGNANDISGNGLNGTLQNGADFAIGKSGQTFRFDGVDDHVQLPDMPALNTGSITVEGWINAEATQNAVGGFVFANRVPNVSESFSIFVTSDQTIKLILGTSGGAATLVSPPSSFAADEFQHIAVTYNGSSTASAFVNGQPVTFSLEDGAFSGNLVASNNSFIGQRESSAGITGRFSGLIDELSVYNRALTQAEIESIFNAGIAGKLKDNTTAAGSDVVVNAKSDGTITFPTVSTTGITQQIPLDLSLLPALPSGTSIGLTYDIATSAVFSGNPTVCFNLPSITDSGVFANLRILHLENNIWENRTDLSSINFGTRTICTNGLTSFSPFALAEFAPSSAAVSIGGRVLSPNGFGVSKAWVTLTEPDGTLRSTQTNAFGYYNFTNIRVGETYILSAFAKQYNFQPRIVAVKNNVSDLNITADK